MKKALVMHFAIESITLLRKYLLVMESWVSKCGSHSYRIEGPCCIRNVRDIVNTGEAYYVGVAKRAVHNFVLEDTALEVVEPVVSHIEPLKQLVVP